ncbi:MAG TPA: Dabb family protein [Polyangiaceae bacterium]
MSIEHMVWFRFREDVAQTRRDAYAAQLKALVGVVPGILRLEVGWNFTDRARGAQLGLLVSLTSKAALEAYQVHPAHVAVATGLRADSEEILALDFESL